MNIIKRVFLSLIVISAPGFVIGQTPYYDAMALRKLINNETGEWPETRDTKKAVADILAHYCKRDDIDKVFLTNNPFVRDYARSWSSRSGEGFTGNDFRPIVRSAMMSADISGIDVTNVANSISEIMINRAKQELTIAFFSQFRTFLEDHKEARTLFPITSDNVSNLLAYRYPELLPTLRTGFFEDLKGLPGNVDLLLENGPTKELLGDIPDIRVVIQSLRLVHQVETGYTNPDEMLAALANLKEWNDTNTTMELKNMGGAFNIGSLLSRSLINDPYQSVDKARTWVKMTDLKLMVEDTIAFRLYLGLIYQEANQGDIMFFTKDGSARFTKLMEQHKNDLLFYEHLVTAFAGLAAKADKLKSDLKYKQDNHLTPSNDDYFAYINTSLDIVENAFSVARAFDEKPDISLYVKIARKTNDLYRHIYKEEYPQAITNAVDIISEVCALVNRTNKQPLIARLNATPDGKALGIARFEDMDCKRLKKLVAAKAASRDIYFQSMAEKLICYYRVKKSNAWINETRKYGLFMSNIVIARSSGEMQSAIENAILPVGSSSIKKHAYYNISLQSYLGAYGRIGHPKTSADIAWNDPFGVTAPIGISISTSIRKTGSISLFVSAVDLGAIVDYKLRTDSVTNSAGQKNIVAEKDYKIQLGQLFSPGVQLVYGFAWNIPLSLGIGGQYGPGLSKIDNGQTVVNNPYWRWTAMLAVDLPFFTIVNKSKNK